MGTGSKVILDGVEKGVGAIGTKGDAAAAGAVTTTDTLLAYQKQIVTFLRLLTEIADGTNVFPASVAEDSLFAKILGKGNPALGTSFDNTTDSLEAISDAIGALPTGTERGTDNAALASVLEDAMQKATGPAYNQDTDSLEAIRELLDTMAAYIDTEVAAILLDTGTDGVVVNSRTQAAERLAGVPQTIEVSITAALNVGLVTVATITAQPCVIDSVVLHADTTADAHMTTCAVEGGASQVFEFIGTTDATQANLNAADKQLGWTGVARFAATKTIVIDLQGSGSNAADLTVTITYHAAVDGGYLA